jgi:hypothetical protein
MTPKVDWVKPWNHPVHLVFESQHRLGITCNLNLSGMRCWTARLRILRRTKAVCCLQVNMSDGTSKQNNTRKLLTDQIRGRFDSRMSGKGHWIKCKFLKIQYGPLSLWSLPNRIRHRESIQLYILAKFRVPLMLLLGSAPVNGTSVNPITKR